MERNAFFMYPFFLKKEANHCIPPTYITFASISNLMKPNDYCFILNRYLWFYKVVSLFKIRSSMPILRKISLKHLLMCKSILVHLAWFIQSLSHLLRVAKYTYWVAFFFEDSYVLYLRDIIDKSRFCCRISKMA